MTLESTSPVLQFLEVFKVAVVTNQYRSRWPRELDLEPGDLIQVLVRTPEERRGGILHIGLRGAGADLQIHQRSSSEWEPNRVRSSRVHGGSGLTAPRAVGEQTGVEPAGHTPEIFTSCVLYFLFPHFLSLMRTGRSFIWSHAHSAEEGFCSCHGSDAQRPLWLHQLQWPQHAPTAEEGWPPPLAPPTVAPPTVAPPPPASSAESLPSPGGRAAAPCWDGCRATPAPTTTPSSPTRPEPEPESGGLTLGLILVLILGPIQEVWFWCILTLIQNCQSVEGPSPALTWTDPSLVLKNQRVVFIRSANRTSVLEQRHTENSPSVSIWSFILTRNHQNHSQNQVRSGPIETGLSHRTSSVLVLS
ncbi:uncharacterized protein LOC106944057 [Poecilia latipinna]|uniref:uncharacterized protein LOC106944057 n=1 Tax=Poecilia latipinna TaxID=48699 RepID=UPI00072DA09B|nr:PREDICTED: uncharacterized protein LOC106944057 [Poecilia latipinna]